MYWSNKNVFSKANFVTGSEGGRCVLWLSTMGGLKSVFVRPESGFFSGRKRRKDKIFPIITLRAIGSKVFMGTK